MYNDNPTLGLSSPSVPSTFLLVTLASTIVQVSLDTPNQDIVVLLEDQNNPAEIDFLLSTPESCQMFWVDRGLKSIFSSGLLGGCVVTVISNSGVPQDLAVDWISSPTYIGRQSLMTQGIHHNGRLRCQGQWVISEGAYF